MDGFKNVHIYFSLDEIIERTDMNEKRGLIKPCLEWLLEYYRGLYDGAVQHEKEFKKRGDKEQVKWQGERKKALKKILDSIFDALVCLDKTNEPLKRYHNELHEARTEVKF